MNRSLFLSITIILFAVAPPFVQSQDVLLYEDFDGVVEPELPSTWTPTGSGWATSTASSSPVSGNNNVVHSGMTAGAITSPSIDLLGYTQGQISYWARRTSSYPQDGFSISASVDGGITFPVVVAVQGVALPAATSTYEKLSFALPASFFNQGSVQFRFEGTGGTTGGSNIRIDDLTITAVADTTSAPPPSGNSIGFQDSSSVVIEAEETSIPIRLSAADSLGGVQFTVTWPSTRVSFLNLERGVPISDSSRWHVDWETQNQSIRVLVLGNNIDGLPPSIYDDFLSLQFQAELLSTTQRDTVALELSIAIGALSQPAGVDAGLTLENGLHMLEIIPSQAYLSILDDTLSFGSILADSVGVQSLELSNVNGSRELTISGISSDTALFEVADTSLILQPGQSASIPIVFRPSHLEFGYQTGVLSVTHDGTDGPTSTVFLSGTGLGGRGDLTTDGLTDVIDVVQSIDLVLNRITIPADRQVTVDLSPFPQGDGEVDIRDLTVLVQGIVRAIWPDGIGLPDPNPNLPSFPNSFDLFPGDTQSAEVHIELVSENRTDYDIFLTQGIPLRGFEMEVSGVEHSDGNVESVATATTGIITTSHLNSENGVFRVLLATSIDELFAPGQKWLGRISVSDPLSKPSISYATGVSASGHRIALSEANISVSVESAIGPVSHSLNLGSPYPNPFVPFDGASLTVPVGFPDDHPGSDARIEVYDLLGRLLHNQSVSSHSKVITWTPDLHRISLSPGLYFVRLTHGKKSISRAFTVLTGS